MPLIATYHAVLPSSLTRNCRYRIHVTRFESHLAWSSIIMEASLLRHMAVCNLFTFCVPQSLESGMTVDLKTGIRELQWSLLESEIHVLTLPEFGISVGSHRNSGF